MFVFTYHVEWNCYYLVGISAVVWTTTRVGDVLPSATLRVFFLRFMVTFLGLGVYSFNFRLLIFSAISELQLLKLKYRLPRRPLPPFIDLDCLLRKEEKQ